MRVCHPDCSLTCIKEVNGSTEVICRGGLFEPARIKMAALFDRRAALGLDTQQPGTPHKGITLIGDLNDLRRK